MTEDEVRDLAGKILKFENTDKAQSGVGQLTSFNQLGFNGIKDRPDGWYLPKNIEEPAIILETKNSNQKLENFLKNIGVIILKTVHSREFMNMMNTSELFMEII